jgi:hypothetical protein
LGGQSLDLTPVAVGHGFLGSGEEFARIGTNGLTVVTEPGPGTALAALAAMARAFNVSNEALVAKEASDRERYVLVKAIAPGARGPVANLEECEPAGRCGPSTQVTTRSGEAITDLRSVRSIGNGVA